MTPIPQTAGLFRLRSQPIRAQRHRTLGVIFAAAIEIGLAYTLLTALGVTPAPRIMPPISGRVIPPVEKTVDVPPPPLPFVTLPKLPDPITREVTIESLDPALPSDTIPDSPPQSEHPASTPAQPPPVTFSPPRALAATHTTPDYPLLSRRLGEQGMLRLKLMITPQGTVSGASVVNSSGFPRLDEAAVQWVIGHWRYQPAMQGTVPVPSTAEAVVTFALK